MLLVIYDKFGFIIYIFTSPIPPKPLSFGLHGWTRSTREKRLNFPFRNDKMWWSAGTYNIFFYNLITLSESTPSFPTPRLLTAESSLIHKKLQYLATCFFLPQTEN